jgi:hypothetical protein
MKQKVFYLEPQPRGSDCILPTCPSVPHVLTEQPLDYIGGPPTQTPDSNLVQVNIYLYRNMDHSNAHKHHISGKYTLIDRFLAYHNFFAAIPKKYRGYFSRPRKNKGSRFILSVEITPNFLLHVNFWQNGAIINPTACHVTCFLNKRCNPLLRSRTSSSWSLRRRRTFFCGKRASACSSLKSTG